MLKSSKVYVKDPKTKNIKKVNFGDPNMRIKNPIPRRKVLELDTTVIIVSKDKGKILELS